MRTILLALLCAAWLASTCSYRHSAARAPRAAAPPRMLQTPLEVRKPVIGNYLLLLAGLPLASLLLPVLLERITDGSATAVERQYSILELLLLKRVYIYATAISTVDLISRTSYNDRSLDSGGFAQRLLRLNNEVFGTNVTVDFSSPTDDAVAIALQEESSAGDDAAVEQAYRMIGSQVKGGTEAALIPIVVAASLLASFGSMLLSRGAGGAAGAAAGGAAASLSLFSNLAVCFLFSKLQLKAAIKSVGGEGGADTAAAAAAAALSLACITAPPSSVLFPLFNAVNAFIAATVARLFLLEQLQFIVAALLAMVAYDCVFVLGSAAFFTDNGQSIMAAVADAKSGIISGSAAVASGAVVDPVASAIAYVQSCWRPGLLEVVVGGRVTDVLGLADMIFPAMLSAYCLREGSERLYASSITGLAAGCLACELLQTGAGQPALLYIVPSMLLAVALERGFSKLAGDDLGRQTTST